MPFVVAATTCGTDTCSNGLESHPRCDGYGTCGSQVKNCGLYGCNAGSCRTVCAADADCTSDAWCSGTTCTADQGLGATCLSASQCASGNCVDGFCCDSACSSTCMACSASLKQSGGNGVCGPTKVATDPKSQCTDARGGTPLSCAANGSCDGTGACSLYANGTSCGTNSCSVGTATSPQCDGLGACKSLLTSCTPYVCGATACLAACATDASCASGYYCAGTVCTSKKPNGRACALGGQCEACTTAVKGTGDDGVCGPIEDGTDPQNECATQATSTCGTAGVCNGARACKLHTAGTTCSANTCSGGNQTSFVCNGIGTCGSAATPCAPYTCNGPSCGTSCTADTGCLANYYCKADGTCQPDQANGAACTAFGQCASGNCVDSFCCDTACTGPCSACSASLQGGGSDGVCGPIKSGSDPQSECASEVSTTCGTTGTCNGSGACALFSQGTVCGSTSCASGWQTGQSCDGSGNCIDANSTGCAPYLCSGTACGSTCTGDGSRIASYYCRTGDKTCQPDQAAGAICSAASQCASGSCVDGVCCDTACQGTCQACSAAKKGVGADGVCGSVLVGRDPDNDCTEQLASSCGTNGTCDGNGACGFYNAGSACGATTCSNGQQTGYACNGLGTCQPAIGSACSPYNCNGSACGATRAVDGDCILSCYCRASAHTCQEDQLNGGACTSGAECASGSCVDGVCCDTACAGTCQACTAAKKGGGVDGACGDIRQGNDPDDECDSQGASSCGTNGSCSGMGTCGLYPQGTARGSTTCNDALQTGQACNGAGNCIDASTTPCAPNKCTGTACAANCADDTQCSAEYFCRISDKTCQPKQPNGDPCMSNGQCASTNCVDGVCCDGVCQGPCMACSYYAQRTSCGKSACQGNVAKGEICNGLGQCASDSGGTDCSPYLCVGSGCAEPCANSAQCVNGNVCDQGACKPTGSVGASCSSNEACDSAFCVDGVCCNNACPGQCEACNLPGTEGQCLPVTGEPSIKPACGGQGDCASICDGTNRTGCTFPGSAVSCARSCVNSAMSVSTCDGNGQCLAGPATSCGGYQCSTAEECKTACDSEADCVAGLQCVEHASVSGTPVEPDAGGTGGTGGSSAQDGAAGNEASSGSGGSSGTGGTDLEDGSVTPASPAAAPSDSGGCGCRTERSGASSWGIAGLALLVLSAGMRRRRFQGASCRRSP